ncbi:MAG TPA: hypothetical protein VJ903_00630 [Clostridia bacterium]|nr:hypothetical protein [Clostridia bacterium]
MKKQNINDIQRLRQIILTDDSNIPNSTVEILKADSKSFFNNHFKLDEKSFSMEISLCENGSYKVDISFKANDIYDIKVIR